MATIGYRMRAAGTGLLGRLPESLAYRVRVFAERHAFDHACCVHDLPPIFHYWSDTHLKPRFEPLGFRSAEDFFAGTAIRAIAERDGRLLEIASLGAGRCELELELADRLEREADGGFRITCLDINPAVLREARHRATARGLAHRFAFECVDLNAWQPARRYDLVLASRCLHHFLALESLLDAVHAALADDGTLLVSDVIGRNGHQLWPEQSEALAPFFAQLPERCRYDRALGATATQFESLDRSGLAFEGIRAQDILPLLHERYAFETFAPFGGLAPLLLERRFGDNFDVARDWDRAFVDRLAAHEHALLDAGTIKPTHLVASLRKSATTLRTITPALTPERAIRRPG